MATTNQWTKRRPIPHCEVGVLYVFGPGAISRTNRMLEFKGSDDRRLRLPLRKLQLVCLYGPVRLTSGALRLLSQLKVPVSYFSNSGHQCFGSFIPTGNDSWRERRYRQYLAVKNGNSRMTQAKKLVTQKIQSMQSAWQHYQRHGRGAAKLQWSSELRQFIDKAERTSQLETLRGIEGIASKQWFERFRSLLPADWSFPGRRKRPPTDPVNALLSLGYTLLFQRVQAALLAWGLDAALGYYHLYRPGRDSLSCDVMEPFRIPVVDRLIYRLLAKKRIKKEHFCQSTNEAGTQLTQPGLKIWLAEFETNWLSHDAGHNNHVLLADRIRQLVESLPRLNT